MNRIANFIAGAIFVVLCVGVVVVAGRIARQLEGVVEQPAVLSGNEPGRASFEPPDRPVFSAHPFNGGARTAS